MDEYTKKCEYCKEEVSVFESVTEFGLHWHEACYIHKTNKEIEAYKKKFINNKLTAGDKADLVDKYNLVQTLMAERTEFKGFEHVSETENIRRMLTDEPDMQVLYGDEWGTHPLFDESGRLLIIADNSPSILLRIAKVRPNVIRIKKEMKPKKITRAEEILQIEGGK